MHQKDRDDDAGKGTNSEKLSHRTATRISSSTLLSPTGGEGGGGVAASENKTQTSHHPNLHLVSSLENPSPAAQKGEAQRRQESSGFLGRFSLSSCTSANSEDGGEATTKSNNNKKKHGDRLSRYDNPEVY